MNREDGNHSLVDFQVVPILFEPNLSREGTLISKIDISSFLLKIDSSIFGIK